MSSNIESAHIAHATTCALASIGARSYFSNAHARQATCSSDTSVGECSLRNRSGAGRIACVYSKALRFGVNRVSLHVAPCRSVSLRVAPCRSRAVHSRRVGGARESQNGVVRVNTRSGFGMMTDVGDVDRLCVWYDPHVDTSAVDVSIVVTRAYSYTTHHPFSMRQLLTRWRAAGDKPGTFCYQRCLPSIVVGQCRHGQAYYSV